VAISGIIAKRLAKAPVEPPSGRAIQSGEFGGEDVMFIMVLRCS